MSGFDVIDTKDEKPETAPNGAEIIRHEEMAFTNAFTDGKSFDDVAEKKVDDYSDTGIHFAFDFKLHPDGVSKLKSLGNQIQSNCCVLQHNLVMYSFAYAISVVGEDPESGLTCKFRLIPVSQTFRYPTGMAKGGLPINYKPDVPELMDAKLMIGSSGALDLVREDNGSFVCETLITAESLINITSKGVTTMRVEMTVESDYFDLGQYIEMNMREAPAVPNSHRILEKILLGEEVPKNDWVITVGDGSPRDFHVHGPVLAHASMTLKAAISNHMSIGNALAMVSHENRFILTNLKSEDMRVLLTFIYQRRFVLPEFDAVGRLGGILSLLFRDDVPEFLKHWEAEIIKQLMALDRSKTVSTVAECVKALLRVSSAPQGGLLAAYNVALVIAADAWQMVEGKGKKLKVSQVKKAIGKDWESIDSIMELIGDFKVSVCGVEKQKYIH